MNTILAVLLVGILFTGGAGTDTGTEIWDYEPAPVGYTHVETVQAPIEEVAPPEDIVANGCITVTIHEFQGHLAIESRGRDTGGLIRTAIVGHYLWVQFTDPGDPYDSLDPRTVSIPVSLDTPIVVICPPDGYDA